MLRIDGWSCVLGALLLLTLPLNWLGAAISAAAFHEACHALAVVALGGRIWSVSIGPGGALMQTSPLGRWQELICALAGPLGSLALIGLAGGFPRVAVCGLCQGLYNLLPIFPLDGGRAVRCLLPGGWIWVERACLGGLLGAALGGLVFKGWGLLPLLMVASMVLRRKKPCKRRGFRVQ